MKKLFGGSKKDKEKEKEKEKQAKQEKRNAMLQAKNHHQTFDSRLFDKTHGSTTSKMFENHAHHHAEETKNVQGTNNPSMH